MNPENDAANEGLVVTWTKPKHRVWNLRVHSNEIRDVWLHSVVRPLIRRLIRRLILRLILRLVEKQKKCQLQIQDVTRQFAKSAKEAKELMKREEHKQRYGADDSDIKQRIQVTHEPVANAPFVRR